LSFQFSPETLIFQINQTIEEKQNELTQALNSQTSRLPALEQKRLLGIADLNFAIENNQDTGSIDRIVRALDSAILALETSVNKAQTEIDDLQKQIPILEKEAQVRKINLQLSSSIDTIQETQILQTEIDDLSIPKIIDFELPEILTDKKDNTLRNVLLAGGALVLLT
jgi:hypothetical protein